MRIKDIASLGIDINEIEIDITPIIEQKFIESKMCNNYREDSVNYFISNTINFHSTQNNFLVLMGRCIKIICPNCEKEISQKGSGGYPSLYTIESSQASSSEVLYTVMYKCNNCDIVVNLSINPDEVISINFDKSRFTVIDYTKDSNEK